MDPKRLGARTSSTNTKLTAYVKERHTVRLGRVRHNSQIGCGHRSANFSSKHHFQAIREVEPCSVEGKGGGGVRRAARKWLLWKRKERQTYDWVSYYRQRMKDCSSCVYSVEIGRKHKVLLDRNDGGKRGVAKVGEPSRSVRIEAGAPTGLDPLAKYIF